MSNFLRLLCVVLCLTSSTAAVASEYRGQVTFSGLPVPGATVTAMQGGKKLVAVTDLQGLYSFPDLADGSWVIQIEMTGFAASKEDAVIAPNMPIAKRELKLLSLDQMRAATKPVQVEAKPTLDASSAAPSSTPAPAKPQDSKVAAKAPEADKPVDEMAQRAADGLLINGSVNNAATSAFAQSAAFGNNRGNGKSLYNGGLALILDNSALDARPLSQSGEETPKASYNRVTGTLTLGGPFKIPRLLPRGPNFTLVYQWTRLLNATTQSALVPDLTGVHVTPVSPVAEALLDYYPEPNLVGNPLYNYQTSILSNTHQDALQTRMNKTIGQKNTFFGGFAFQSSRSSSASLFHFVDKTDVLGINTNINWSHRYNQRFFQTVGYQFSRLRTEVTSNFANRKNVSFDAGIIGTDQDPMSWGPPTLVFSSGIASLTDAQSAFNRNRTDALTYSLQWNHLRHNVTGGFDFRRQQFNYLSQQNPQGMLTFTGAAGADLVSFLQGLPNASSISFGNADKYLRQSVYDAYITDDWRISPQLTLNAGIRWEYGAPITETKDRLVNLDVASGFAAIAPVLASNPTGLLTGQRYPNSLVRPDRRGIEPRIGVSWRPLSGSSMVVRAGYGIYDDTSVYQANALNLAQQPPLSTSLNASNSECLIALANPYTNCGPITSNTFAIDPNFRVGYAQNWQLAVQRDLPGSLQMTATYLGIKGTRGVQAFLPNTVPIGAPNPCAACPAGFTYRTSNGNSTREAGQIQLRRRLRSGFTASLQYTYSKSIDDDAVLGGQGPVAAGVASATGTSAQSASAASTAQDWTNLKGERGLSTFDQRHLLNVQMQYTTGMGLGGRTLMGGWKGSLLKEWTVVTNIAAGSGLPETPIYLATVPGTSVTGTIRPSYTGAPVYGGKSGYFLNGDAFRAPTLGQWGDAGRDSIIGPHQFTLNASLARTIRLKGRYNLDLRFDSTNLLNHVTYGSFNTIYAAGSTQFGLPVNPNSMRTVQTTLRLRY